MSSAGITAEDRRLLDGAKVFLSFSGGKDSTACALLLESFGIPFVPVFMDTGWEHPALLEYIRGPVSDRFGPVKEIRSKKYPQGMAEAIRKKGMFPGRRARWCTEELKIKPWQEFLALQEGPIVTVLGVRRQESAARRAAARWDYDAKTGADVFRPLVDWTFEDVIKAHQAAKMPPNPLYLQGAERVGCFPCIFSRKSEILFLSEVWPERVEEIAEMERALTLKRKEKSAEAHAASFFGERSAAVGAVNIGALVEWSRTTRGGRQLALFNDTGAGGCARWGMCEAPEARPDALKVINE
jgi:3'-phosphoadenosine 5'-phosphosulfate sulfotransferase (PAPS reductase)/FAD synthetase